VLSGALNEEQHRYFFKTISNYALRIAMRVWVTLYSRNTCTVWLVWLGILWARFIRGILIDEPFVNNQLTSWINQRSRQLENLKRPLGYPRSFEPTTWRYRGYFPSENKIIWDEHWTNILLQSRVNAVWIQTNFLHNHFTNICWRRG